MIAQQTGCENLKSGQKNRLIMEPINTAGTTGYSAEIQDYFAHYDLTCDESIEHRFGTFQSGRYTLAGHLYKPAVCRATVVCVHGYLNHTGQFKHLIQYLLKQDYAVAIFDLPGHGLSSGKTAAIDNFDEYTKAMEDFMAIVHDTMPAPYHAVGLSTGCSILIDRVLEGKSGEFDKIVLAAPLVRWSFYEPSKATHAVIRCFTSKLPRFDRNNSSDRDYNLFNWTQDYLHADCVSLDWVKALIEWNDKIESLGPVDRPILILQGDRDVVVDWKYNLRLLREKCPGAVIEMVPGAKHELFNESLEIRQQVLYDVDQYLQQTNVTEDET